MLYIVLSLYLSLSFHHSMPCAYIQYIIIFHIPTKSYQNLGLLDLCLSRYVLEVRV